MDQQQSEAPTVQVPTTTQPAPDTTLVSDNKRKLLALWLLIGPTALIVGTIILYAISNLISEQIDPGPDQTTAMFGAPTLGGMLVNSLLFFIGATSVLAWLPCLIIGIILLASKKKA